MEKFFFDINLPRLQDYDFLLRIIPKVKVSFTNEVLVDINIQKDSISNSLIKLQKAIKIILIIIEIYLLIYFFFNNIGI